MPSSPPARRAPAPRARRLRVAAVASSCAPRTNARSERKPLGAARPRPILLEMKVPPVMRRPSFLGTKKPTGVERVGDLRSLVRRSKRSPSIRTRCAPSSRESSVVARREHGGGDARGKRDDHLIGFELAVGGDARDKGHAHRATMALADGWKRNHAAADALRQRVDELSACRRPSDRNGERGAPFVVFAFCSARADRSRLRAAPPSP